MSDVMQVGFCGLGYQAERGKAVRQSGREIMVYGVSISSTFLHLPRVRHRLFPQHGVSRISDLFR